MKFSFHKNNPSDGQMMILAIVVSAVLLSLITGLVGYWMSQIGHHRQAVGRAKALSIAEAGVEMAIWKLNNVPGYIGENLTPYGEGVFTVEVTNLSSTTRQIRAHAYIPNATAPRARRTVQMTAVIGTTNVGFNYGVQVGNGGIEMTNSSRIVGNVYANSNIVGSGTSSISGTAIAAGNGYIEGMDVGGNAQAHTIRGNSNVDGNVLASVFQNSTALGNVDAGAISNCTIGGTAIYNTRLSCNVNGAATTPNPNAYAPAPVLPLPISEAQIDTWETEAAAGGTIGTQNFNSGTRNLGPVKIDGDLILTNTAEVVITGTLWVTGQLRLSNNTTFRLSPAYGGLSGVVIVGVDEDPAKGYIELANDTVAEGSGDPGSYLMLLSQREGTGSVAINNANNGTAAILYAGEGTIEIGNFADMKEITAEKLRITNNAIVTYEIGLANTAFSSGPGGGWELQPGTWQLLQ